jgi:hypothetical protein
MTATSGQGAFKFSVRQDLSVLPKRALPYETHLHGGFAIDARTGRGEIYYGMPGCGIVKVSADLTKQEVLRTDNRFDKINFHSTKIFSFEGKESLYLASDSDEKVVILSLDGELKEVFTRPAFAEYRKDTAAFHPTDTVLWHDQLFIADGYGSNYVTAIDVNKKQWKKIFGGKSVSLEDGKFTTAHGMGLHPLNQHLSICDRPNGVIKMHNIEGDYIDVFRLPQGAYLCGINYFKKQSRWYAVIGCLQDPDIKKGRSAPIYIVDAESFELLSIIRPKDELGVEHAVHIHNVVMHIHNDRLYLVCQSWNPGHYFVLQHDIG